MSRVEESRFRFERAWTNLSRSLRAEVGWEPRLTTSWLVPIVGLAAGLALGTALFGRRRRPQLAAASPDSGRRQSSVDES